MANQLKSIVSFTGLVVGVPVASPHGLNQDGRGLIPDLGALNDSGFEATADDTDVTVTRETLASAAAVDVYVISWHTLTSVFGPTNPPPGALPRGNLTPQPFFITQGGAGAGGCMTPVITAVSLGAAIDDLMLVDPSAGGVVITLPPITVGNGGCKIVVKNNTASVVLLSIVPNAANTIDLAPAGATIAAAFGSITFRSDGVVGGDWAIT